MFHTIDIKTIFFTFPMSHTVLSPIDYAHSRFRFKKRVVFDTPMKLSQVDNERMNAAANMLFPHALPGEPAEQFKKRVSEWPQHCSPTRDVNDYTLKVKLGTDNHRFRALIKKVYIQSHQVAAMKEAGKYSIDYEDHEDDAATTDARKKRKQLLRRRYFYVEVVIRMSDGQNKKL